MIHLPRTQKEYKEALSKCALPRFLFLSLTVLCFFLLLIGYVSYMIAGEEGWVWENRPGQILLVWAVLLPVFGGLGLYYSRIYSTSREQVFAELRSVVEGSGIQQFPSPEDFLAELREAVFIGDVSRIIALDEQQQARWGVYKALVEALEFAEDEPDEWNYGKPRHSIFGDGDPLDRYYRRWARKLNTEEALIDSPSLIALVWYASTQEQKAYWRDIAKKNTAHHLFCILPQKDFIEFVASRGPK